MTNIDSIYVYFFFLLGVAFISSAFTVSWIFRPDVPSAAKRSPYECGESVEGSSRVQFNVRYYLFALIFVVFDVEVIFLIPWAVVFKSLGTIAFIQMTGFIAVLLLGLFYAWKKGALEWQ